MNEGTDLLAELYPRCFCRTNRRPLKVGIYEEVISQHPEMSGPQIKRLLKKYTQCPEYWSTLTTGTPRIDLEGNVAGEVTVTDEADAKRKIAIVASRSSRTFSAAKRLNIPSATNFLCGARSYNVSHQTILRFTVTRRSLMRALAVIATIVVAAVYAVWNVFALRSASWACPAARQLGRRIA